MAKEAAEAAIAVVRGAAGAGAEAEQLDMLMPPTRASMTEGELDRVDREIRHNRRGRPPGAQNKTTREMLDYVRKTMGDPLMERFRYTLHTPESFAIEMGCSKLEAYDRLDKLRADLAGYWYAKLAQVDSAGNAVTPRLTMVFPGQGAPQIGADGAPEAPWLYLRAANAEVQQNQGFLASPDGVSHGDVSHDDDKDSNISGLAPSGR